MCVVIHPPQNWCYINYIIYEEDGCGRKVRHSSTSNVLHFFPVLTIFLYWMCLKNRQNLMRWGCPCHSVLGFPFLQLSFWNHLFTLYFNSQHMLLGRVCFQNSEEFFFLTGNLVLSNIYKTLPLAITSGRILHIKLQGSRQRLNMVSFWR